MKQKLIILVPCIVFSLLSVVAQNKKTTILPSKERTEFIEADTTARAVPETDYKLKTGGVEKGVVGVYDKIENGTVSAYYAVENFFVGAYRKIENWFVGAFLEKNYATQSEQISQNIKNNKQ